MLQVLVLPAGCPVSQLKLWPQPTLWASQQAAHLKSTPWSVQRRRPHKWNCSHLLRDKHKCFCVSGSAGPRDVPSGTPTADTAGSGDHAITGGHHRQYPGGTNPDCSPTTGQSTDSYRNQQGHLNVYCWFYTTSQFRTEISLSGQKKNNLINAHSVFSTDSP